jgi:hypothetical protein
VTGWCDGLGEPGWVLSPASNDSWAKSRSSSLARFINRSSAA